MAGHTSELVELPQGFSAVIITPSEIMAGVPRYLSAVRNKNVDSAHRPQVAVSAGEAASRQALAQFDGLFGALPAESQEAFDYSQSRQELVRTYRFGAQQVGAVSMAADRIKPFVDKGEEFQRDVLLQLLFDAANLTRIARGAGIAYTAPLKNIGQHSTRQSLGIIRKNGDSNLRFKGGRYVGGWLQMETRI